MFQSPFGDYLYCQTKEQLENVTILHGESFSPRLGFSYIVSPETANSMVINSWSFQSPLGDFLYCQ